MVLREQGKVLHKWVMSFDVEKKCQHPEPTEDTEGLTYAKQQLINAKTKLKEVVVRDFSKTDKQKMLM